MMKSSWNRFLLLVLICSTAGRANADDLYFPVFFNLTKDGFLCTNSECNSKRSTFVVSRELLQGLARVENRIQLRKLAVNFCEKEIISEESKIPNDRPKSSCVMRSSIEKFEANMTLSHFDRVLQCASDLIEYIFPYQDECQKSFGDLLDQQMLAQLKTAQILHPLAKNYFDAGGKVIAYIFSGRRKYLSILVQYLLRDRRRPYEETYIGIISKVVLFQNTLNPIDISYMGRLASTYPDYFEIRPVREDAIDGYCSFWKNMITERVGSGAGNPTDAERVLEIGLKIDDDIVYLAEDALYQLLLAKLKSLQKRQIFMQYIFPQRQQQSNTIRASGGLVAADDDDANEVNELIHTPNIINHPRLSQLHQKLGAFAPRNLMNLFIAKEERDGFELGLLPSISEICFNGDSCGWQNLYSGAHALLQHMTFLNRLEECLHSSESDLGVSAAPSCSEETSQASSSGVSVADALREVYDFNRYDFDAFGYGDRWSINVLMFMKHDMERKFSYDRCFHINDNWGDSPRARCISSRPGNPLMRGATTPEQIARAAKYSNISSNFDDEGYISQILPVESHTRAVAVGASIVAHYAYSTQRVFLDTLTELHAKYCKLAPTEYIE